MFRCFGVSVEERKDQSLRTGSFSLFSYRPTETLKHRNTDRAAAGVSVEERKDQSLRTDTFSLLLPTDRNTDRAAAPKHWPRSGTETPTAQRNCNTGKGAEGAEEVGERRGSRAIGVFEFRELRPKLE